MPRARFLAVVTTILISGASLASNARVQVPQPAAAPPGTGLILGQVVDVATNRGVSGVVVSIGPAAPTPPPIGELLEARPPLAAAGPNVKRSLTGADGRFVFRDLPKGRYTITTTSPGYVNGAYGQSRPDGAAQMIDLDDAQKTGGVTVRIWKFASISGRVVDELGDPAVAVNVRCMRRVFSGGQKRLTTGAGLVYTDDRGMYRASSLVPGEYVCGVPMNQTTMPMSVAAASEAASQSGNPNASDAYRSMQNSAARTFSGAASGTRVGDLGFASTGVSVTRGLPPPAPDADGRMMAYGPQYFGGATTTRQAAPIALKPGEDRTGIDLQLKLLPAVRITGRVVGPAGPGAFLGMSLMPLHGSDLTSEGQAEVGSTVSDPTGAFTFLGIPAGQYVVRVRLYPRPIPGGSPVTILDTPGLWANVPLTVADADISDLVVTLRPGLRVTGRVEFVGSRAQPTPADIARIGIRLQSAEGRTSSPIATDGKVAPDLTFRTAGYAGGRYLVIPFAATIPPGWTLKSVTASGRDVSIEPLDLSENDASGVVITFTDQTTQLSGTVRNSNGPDATAEVVVLPADSLAWKEIGVTVRRGRVERVDRTGAFSFTGLPAGEYFVAVIPANSPSDPQDPAFLDVLSRSATRVTLADGGKASVQLTTRAK